MRWIVVWTSPGLTSWARQGQVLLLAYWEEEMLTNFDIGIVSGLLPERRGMLRGQSRQTLGTIERTMMYMKYEVTLLSIDKSRMQHVCLCHIKNYIVFWNQTCTKRYTCPMCQVQANLWSISVLAKELGQPHGQEPVHVDYGVSPRFGQDSHVTKFFFFSFFDEGCCLKIC